MRLVARVLVFVTGSSALLAGLLVQACVGDDPDAASSPDAAESDAPASEDAPSEGSSTNDASSPGVIEQIAAGGSFACARTSGGYVYCWGDNSLGQTAQPANGDALCGAGNAPCRPPTRVDIDDVAFIAAGTSSACAVKRDGSVHCWGANGSAQLGHDPSVDPFCPGSIHCSTTPTKIEGLGDIVGMAMGPADACAYTKAGRVYCWGANGLGQLGNGTHDTPPGAPSPLDTLASGVTQIMATKVNVHYCARKTDGTMLCWGRNQSGEVGYPAGNNGVNQNCGGTTWCQPTPTLVEKPDGGGALVPVESIAGGDSTTCASVGGTIWCWGYQGHGMVGFSTDINVAVRPLPGAPSQLGGLAGSHTHACAIGVGGVTYCWGKNDRAQTATPPDPDDAAVACTGPCVPVPVKVENVRAASLSAGQNFTLALTPEGDVLGWGANGSGQLGHPPDAAETAACAGGPCVITATKISVIP